MEELEKYLLKNAMFPKMDFDDKRLHTFKILKGKVDAYEDGTEYFKMLVEEDGEMMTITTPTVLIEIRKCQEGDIYSVIMKTKLIAGSPIKTYDVNKVRSGEKPKEATKEQKEILDGSITDKEPTKEELDNIFGKQE